MSIKIMSKVWEGYPGDSSPELLILLALADWSDDDGRCFPSIAAISRKCRVKTRQAQRHVHSLIDNGIISVTENNHGGKPGSTRRYRINLSRLTGVIDDRGVIKDTGVIDDVDGCHFRYETGVIDDTLTIIDTSITTKSVSAPSVKAKKKASEITLQAFLDACKAGCENAIHDNDPIFAYADKVGISREMVSACWAEFKAAYLNPSKLQADWRAAFRNAVRKNYYKLWYLKEGEAAQWTTAGEQARRAAA